jgi:hypothetical protein
VTDFKSLVAALRAAFGKHPERAQELTREYLRGLHALLGEDRELDANEYARANGYKKRTVWKACRDGRLAGATKRDGSWRIPCGAKLARGNSPKQVRVRVSRATQLGPGRWHLELECGHNKEVTSPSKPQHATCPTCSGCEGAP